MSTGNNKKEYFTIGEVSEITGIKSTVLRFWETEFEILNPIKNKFGHRAYTDNDIEVINKIKYLLYEKGLTIKGAINFLKSNNTNSIMNANDIKDKLKEILEILKNDKGEK